MTWPTLCPPPSEEMNFDPPEDDSFADLDEVEDDNFTEDYYDYFLTISHM